MATREGAPGTNLALLSSSPESWVSYHPNQYMVARIDLSCDLVRGRTYTATVWGGPVTRSDRQSCWYALYWGGGKFTLANLAQIGDGVYRATFTVSETSDATHEAGYVRVYNTPAQGASGTEYSAPITRVKIEPGAYASAWTASPLDAGVTGATRSVAQVTVCDQTDIVALVVWYRLTTSSVAPTRPATTGASSTPEGWSLSEPAFTTGTVTSYLYTCLQTVWGDGTCDWGDVQLDSGYEAAKQAYNRAVAAGEVVEAIDVGGRNLAAGTGAAVAVSPSGNNTYCSPNLYPASPYGLALLADETVGSFVVSFDWEATGANTAVEARISLRNEDSSYTTVGRFAVQEGDSSGHFSTVFSPTARQRASRDGAWLFGGVGTANRDLQVTISNFKFERGTLATDWTPAPEDVTLEIGAADAKAEDALGRVARAQPFVVGTQAAATRWWEGGCPELEGLEDGQQIVYWLPYATAASAPNSAPDGSVDPAETGTSNLSNVWLRLGLADGDTGWVRVYYNGTTRLTTHYAAGNVVRLTYRSTGSGAPGWWSDANYYQNTNNYDRILHNADVKAASAITKNKLVVGTGSGYVNLASNVEFDLAYPVLWASAAIAAGATAKTTYEAYPSVPLNTTASVQGGAAGLMAWLKGTLTAAGKFKVAASGYLTAQVPTSPSSPRAVYLPLGIMYSATACMFQTSARLWAFEGGKFQPLDLVADSKADEAARTATDYVTQHAGGDVWIHAEGAGPGSNGAATQATRGWSIGDSLQLWRGTLSMLKAWVENGAAKLRLGAESAAHLVLSGTGAEVFASIGGAVKSVASLGAQIALGEADGHRLVLDGTGIHFQSPGEDAPETRMSMRFPEYDQATEAFATDDVRIEMSPHAPGNLIYDSGYQDVPVGMGAVVDSDMNWLVLGNPGVGVRVQGDAVSGIPLSCATVSASKAYTCAAGSNAAVTVDFDIPAGYVLVSVTCTALGGDAVVTRSFQYSAGGTAATWYLRNTGSASYSGTLTLRANCMKVG